MLRENSFEITIGRVQTLSSFEKQLNENYAESLKNNDVIFDLRKLEWIGILPAGLLFSWVAYLVHHKNVDHVEIRLPEKDFMPRQVRKVLLSNGIIARWKELGVKVPYYSSEYPVDGLPLKIFSSDANLWSTFKDRADELVRRMTLPESESQIIKDAFEIVIYELAENALLHGKGKIPHYEVSRAISSGPKLMNGGFMTVFDRGVPYWEIMLGDLGPGIHKYLEPIIDHKYDPPFSQGRRFLKSEKILLYAFDFYSTSDPESRRKRIAELLREEEIVDSSKIATGLCCVLKVARSRHGQLVVRTPKAILSIDFYKNHGNPKVMGRKDLGLKCLAPLKGTHYLLRLPLFPRTQKRLFVQNPLMFRNLGQVEVIAPFDDNSLSEEVAPTLDSAIKKVNDHLMRYQKTRGVTLIMPPNNPLMTRAISVFTAGILAMEHGKRILFWCNPRAYSFFERENYVDYGSGLSSMGDYPVFVGDIMANTFLLLGDYDPNLANWLEQPDQTNKAFSMNEQSLNLLRSAYISKLKLQLEKTLRVPDVLHAPGPFLIEGKYYTEKYYEIPKALESPTQLRRFAEWCFMQISAKVTVIIAASSSVKDLVEELSDIIGLTRQKPQILTFNPPYSPASIFVESIPLKNQACTIVTDVICRGKNIRDLLSYLPSLKCDTIITLVDARSSELVGRDLQYATGKAQLIHVDSVLADAIDQHFDPPRRYTSQQTNDNELGESIYIVDHRIKPINFT